MTSAVAALRLLSQFADAGTVEYEPMQFIEDVHGPVHCAKFRRNKKHTRKQTRRSCK